MGVFDELAKLASGAVPLAVQGVTAYRGAKQEQTAQNAGVMQQLEEMAARRQRQAQQDAMEADFKRSQIAENEAQTQSLRQPKPIVPQRIDPLSKEGISAQRQIDGYRASLRPASTAQHGKPGRPIPSSAVEKLAGIDNLLSMAGEVQRGLASATTPGQEVNATGRLFGVVPTASWMKNLIGMGDTKENRGAGTDLRALIGNLYATVAKERGGTALSANEIRLLESYLPNENEDENIALRKTIRFITELKRMKASKVKAYQQYGYGNGIVDDEAPMQDQVTRGGLPHEEY